MRIIDWSSDVCSSDLQIFSQFIACEPEGANSARRNSGKTEYVQPCPGQKGVAATICPDFHSPTRFAGGTPSMKAACVCYHKGIGRRSEEHTSELQSLMRISYAVFCLKKNTSTPHQTRKIQHLI